MKDFYVFRHGETSYNVSGHIQGHSNDSRLTANGKLQARAAGYKLKSKNIEIIFSSPLDRAVETGRIIADIIKVPLQTDERLIEVNVGIAEGMHYLEAEKQFADLYRRWRSTDPQYADTRFEGGETKNEVRARIFEALNFYAAETPYHHIAVSAHGITLTLILQALQIQRYDIPNCTIVHLAYNKNNWQFVEYLN